MIKESVDEFLKKSGGIAYNQSLTPIEKAMNHIINVGKSHCSYWNQQRAKILLEEYVEYLRFRDWNDDDILADLNGNMMRETRKIRSWSQWRDMMEEIVGQDAEEE